MTPHLPLNADQRAAVNATDGALLVLAGAGTGKTHTVIARIAKLLADGVKPENILAVTFTNKAAAELKTRLRRQFAADFPIEKLLACTFHSLGLQILRRDYAAAGLEKKFSLIDQGEQIAIVRKVSRNVRGGNKISPADLLAKIGGIKDAGMSPTEFSRRAVSDAETILSSVYRKYQETLRLRGAVDFDDLLLRAQDLLAANSSAREHWTDRFHHIIVDEFQDASDLQYRLIKTLASKWKNLCVVGDDDQSIYSWRGAAPRHILNFGQDWENSTIIALRENYRSTDAILKIANAIIANNSARHKKELFSPRVAAAPPRLIECADQEKEAELIANEIRKRVETKRNVAADFAIIVRANALTAPIEEKLLAAKLPFAVIGGSAFFDSKEVRDVLAFLTVAENPRDDGALRRIINVPARGIGEKTIETMLTIAAQKNCPLFNILRDAENLPLATPAKNAVKNFTAQLEDWQNSAKANPKELVAKILADTDYSSEVADLYDNPLTAAGRMDMASEVGEDAARFIDAGGTLTDYLAETALNQTRFAGADKRESAAVKIITIHSAKGLEFPVVYVAGVEENNLPHWRSIAEENIDEERRLFYVAVTRARDELTVTYCRGRGGRAGKTSPQIPSRFLGEIPPELWVKSGGEISDEDIAARLEQMRLKLAR